MVRLSGRDSFVLRTRESVPNGTKAVVARLLQRQLCEPMERQRLCGFAASERAAQGSPGTCVAMA